MNRQFVTIIAFNKLDLILLEQQVLFQTLANPTWLNANFDAISQVLTLTGTPSVNNLQQQSFEYSYTLTEQDSHVLEIRLLPFQE